MQKPKMIVAELQPEIDRVAEEIISKADIPTELKEKLRGVKKYIVGRKKGWAKWNKGYFTVPKWAYDKKDEGYFIYYTAHELSHWACFYSVGVNLCATHNKFFYENFLKICPKRYQHYELAYIKKSRKYGVPTYEQCMLVPAEQQTPATEHCETSNLPTFVVSKEKTPTMKSITLPEEQQAKELAKKMIFPYVARGDSYEQIRSSQHSSASKERWIQIDGYLDKQKLGSDKIAVSEIAGKKVKYIFSLKKLYDEIRAELGMDEEKLTGEKEGERKVGMDEAKIQPREIRLNIRSEKPIQEVLLARTYDEANKIYRKLLDDKANPFSDLEYKIIFEDGYVLEGVIDSEPSSFWEDKKNPFTWHLNTFWGNASRAERVEKHPEYDLTIKAKKIVDKYDLGEKIYEKEKIIKIARARALAQKQKLELMELDSEKKEVKAESSEDKDIPKLSKSGRARLENESSGILRDIKEGRHISATISGYGYIYTPEHKMVKEWFKKEKGIDLEKLSKEVADKEEGKLVEQEKQPTPAKTTPTDTQKFKGYKDYINWIETEKGKPILSLTEEQIAEYLDELPSSDLLGQAKSKRDRVDKMAQMIVYNSTKNVPDNELTLEQYATKHFIKEAFTEAMFLFRPLAVFPESYRKEWMKAKGTTESTAPAPIPTPALAPIDYRQYHFYTDGSHGWLKVPLDKIRELGIAKDISSSSYMDEQYAYLEEDVDLTTFFKALGLDGDEKREERQKFWDNIGQTDTSTQRSEIFIRKLPSFNATLTGKKITQKAKKELGIKPTKNITAFVDFIDEDIEIAYNVERRKEFGKLGKKAMKELAELLELNPYEVDYNPSGIAGSGDVHLMGMYDDKNGVYISINETGMYYRTIKDMKDFSGGSNHHFDTKDLRDIYGFVEKVKHNTAPFIREHQQGGELDEYRAKLKELTLNHYNDILEQIKARPDAVRVEAKTFDEFHKQTGSKYYLGGSREIIDENPNLYLFYENPLPFKNDYYEAFDESTGVGYYLPYGTKKGGIWTAKPDYFSQLKDLSRGRLRTEGVMLHGSQVAKWVKGQDTPEAKSLNGITDDIQRQQFVVRNVDLQELIKNDEGLSKYLAFAGKRSSGKPLKNTPIIIGNFIDDDGYAKKGTILYGYEQITDYVNSGKNEIPALVSVMDSMQEGGVLKTPCNVTRNLERNGIEVRFPEKPSREVIDHLKANGFRFSVPQKMWWTRFTPEKLEVVADLCDSKGAELSVSKPSVPFVPRGKMRLITPNILTSKGRVPKNILLDEIRAGKLEVAQTRKASMFDGYDYISEKDWEWKDPKEVSYLMESIHRANTHWTNAIHLEKDGKIDFGGYKLRYKEDIAQPEVRKEEVVIPVGLSADEGLYLFYAKQYASFAKREYLLKIWKEKGGEDYYDKVIAELSRKGLTNRAGALTGKGREVAQKLKEKVPSIENYRIHYNDLDALNKYYADLTALTGARSEVRTEPRSISPAEMEMVELRKALGTPTKEKEIEVEQIVETPQPAEDEKGKMIKIARARAMAQKQKLELMELAEPVMAKGGKLLGTSPTLEGIKSIISQYLYGSTITLIPLEDSDIYEVHTKKGKTSYTVVKKGNRYRFQETSGGSTMAEGGMLGKDKYKSIFEDADKDTILNPDDPNPYVAGDKHTIEEVKIADEIENLIDIHNRNEATRKVLAELLKEVAPTSEIKSRSKTPFSIINKLRRKRIYGAKGLTDLIGGMIVAKDIDEVNQVVEKIKNGALGVVIEHENFYETPLDGYRAHHFVIDYKGLPVEVQVKTERMNKISLAGHTAYKTGKIDTSELNRLSLLSLRADSGDYEAIKQFDMLSEPEMTTWLMKNMSSGGFTPKPITPDIAEKMFFLEYEDGGGVERTEFIVRYEKMSYGEMDNFTETFTDKEEAMKFAKQYYAPIDYEKTVNGNLVESGFVDTTNGSLIPYSSRRRFADGGMVEYKIEDTPLVLRESETDTAVMEAPAPAKVKSTLGKEDKTKKYVREIDISLKNLKDIPNVRINSSVNARDVLMEVWDKKLLNVQEQFYILLTDRRNNIIGYEDISKGGISGTIADITLVGAIATKALAKGVIIAHNHPSGDTSPSKEDLNLTNKIRDGLKLLEITLLDHIIFAPDGSYFSFADEGRI